MSPNSALLSNRLADVLADVLFLVTLMVSFGRRSQSKKNSYIFLLLLLTGNVCQPNAARVFKYGTSAKTSAMTAEVWLSITETVLEIEEALRHATGT